MAADIFFKNRRFLPGSPAVDRCSVQTCLSMFVQHSTFFVRFPFLCSAHLYGRAEGSRIKAQAWSNTLRSWENVRSAGKKKKAFTRFNISSSSVGRIKNLHAPHLAPGPQVGHAWVNALILMDQDSIKNDAKDVGVVILI